MRKQKGFNLIELMIASGIGVFFITAVINLFITTNKSVSLNDAMSQNQETGRFAMDYITQFVRQAGYVAEQNISYVPPLYLPPDCDNDNCTENDVAGLRGDRLSIPLHVPTDENMRTCSGTQVIGPRLISNVFWVSENADTNRQLRCRSYDITNDGWLDQNAVSLVDNIESMNFQIGVSAQPEYRHASRYINVANYINDVNNGSITVNNIRSLRLSILTTSLDSNNENAKQSTVKKRQYVLLDSPIKEYEDSNLRNIFSNTIELVNAIESASENY